MFQDNILCNDFLDLNDDNSDLRYYIYKASLINNYTLIADSMPQKVTLSKSLVFQSWYHAYFSRAKLFQELFKFG